MSQTVKFARQRCGGWNQKYLYFEVTSVDRMLILKQRMAIRAGAWSK